MKCPTKDFECKASFGNGCAHCVRFWSREEAEEMGLDALEDLRI